jgi:hypothetical protein
MNALECVIVGLLHRHHRQFASTCSHLQGGNKNTATIIICWNQCTDKPHK